MFELILSHMLHLFKMGEVVKGEGSMPDQAHVTFEDQNVLNHFVYAGNPPELPGAGGFIIWLFMDAAWFARQVFFVNGKRSEFDDGKGFAMQPKTFLKVKNGDLVDDFHDQGGK
jgi:hypothetical protein